MSQFDADVFDASTLTDLLLTAAEASQQPIVLPRVFGRHSEWTYQQLLTRALGVLDGIQSMVGRNQSHLVLAASDPAAFLPAFWACQLGGITPVPSPPVRSDNDPNAGRLASVVRTLADPLVLCEDRFIQQTQAALAASGHSGPLAGVEQIRTEAEGIVRLSNKDAAAWIQFSSGTTGSPKGLLISQGAALTNLAQMLARSEFGPEDIELGWMPLFHDMGLVGCHLLALAVGAKQVRLAPEDFLRRPAVWMDLATKHRATLLTATNTAIELFLRRVPVPISERWNLESVRLLMVGAEPVSMRNLRALAERLEPAGLSRRSLHVPYGLAEATVGVSFSGPDEPMEPLTVSRKALSEGRVVPLASSLSDGIEIPDVGRPLDGVEVRITDPDGVQLAQDQVGEIQISGPNITRAIVLSDGSRNPVGDWLRTGDLGFSHGDRLYVCGRIKEILIQNGRNILAQDAEEVVSQTEGVRRAVVCTAGQASEEEIALFLVPDDSSWKQSDPNPGHPEWQRLAEMAERARAVLASATGLEATRTVVIESGQIPRTSSGKVRRYLLGKWLGQGLFADGERLLAEAQSRRSKRPRPESRSVVPKASGTGFEQRTTVPDGTDTTSTPSAVPAITFSKQRGDKARKAQQQEDKAERLTGDLEPPSKSSKKRRRDSKIPGHAGRPAGDDVNDRPDDIEKLVRRTWAQVLGRDVETIDSHVLFSSLGGTSVKAQEILGILEEALDIDLSSQIMAGDVTPKRLSQRLTALLSARLPRIQASSLRTDEYLNQPGPIAVVGLAARLGPTDSGDEFFDALLEGRDLTGPLPDRWPADSTEGLTCRAGSFLHNPYAFDPSYFDSDDQEWIVTDPQQRLFAELSLTALELAGLGRPGRKGLVTGVFAGASQVGHAELVSSPPRTAALLRQLRRSGMLDQVASWDPDLAESLERTIQTTLAGRADPAAKLHPATLAGNLLNMIAARTAHELGLEGPALTVDTACSSAGVALHLACESLKKGECDLALTGAVNLNLTPTVYRFFDAAGVLSRSGRCRPFTNTADGFVPGEGGAVLVLARLQDALKRSDRVLAVIHGSAVNNDGSALSIMAPNPEGQRRVIRRAWQASGMDLQDAAFIEAHGTATAIGDPVEARVLDRLFPAGRRRALGSVKANIGHLLGAAASAGLVKTILALSRGVLPPSLLEGGIHRGLGLSPDKWVLPTEPMALGSDSILAGLSSFGFGGTNCHIVLGSPPPTEGHITPLPREVLRLSAPTARHLKKQAQILSKETADKDATRVAADLAQGRTSYRHRAFALVEPTENPAHLFEELVRRPDETDRWHRSEAPGPIRIALLYPGQGSQRPFQALGLYERLPIFRKELDSLANLLPDMHLVESCYGAGASQERLTPSNVAQPLLVAFQIAMTKVLLAAGIQPAAVCGHSVGELAAAWAAGMVDQADAVQWAARRGALMQGVEQTGSMAAAAAPVNEVERLLDPQGLVVVAAVNGPAQTVLSGPTQELAETIRRMEQEGIPARPIPVGHAFHSPLMEPVAEKLRAALDELPTSRPLLPFASTVLGRVLDSEKLPEGYWIDHILHPVRFDRAFSALSQLPIDAFVEIGPAGVLASLARRMLPAHDPRLVVSLTRNSTEPNPEQDLVRFETSMSLLWAAGSDLDLESLWQRGKSPGQTPGPVMLRRNLRSPAAEVTRPLQQRIWRPLRRVRDKIEGTWIFLTPWPKQKIDERTESIAAAMIEAGGRVVWARAARGLARTSETELEFDPLDPRQVEWAMRMVGPDIRGLVLTAWQGNDVLFESTPGKHRVPDPAESPELGALSDLDLLGFTERFSILLRKLAVLSLSLSQGMASAGLEDLTVTWLTRRATDAESAPEPMAAAERIAAMAAMEERHAGHTRWLDVGRRSSAQTTAAVLAAGLSAAVTDSGALRPALGPADISSETPLAGPAVILGSGALASVVAPVLARLGCSPLVVASRSRNHASALAESLKRGGYEACFLTVDLTNPEEVRSSIQVVGQRHGPIAIVVHAATGLVLGSLQSRTDSDLASVLGPKVTGSLALAQALEGQPATKVLLLSSLSGSRSAMARAMADYAAANAFQDALAAQQWQRGRPWRSLVLGPVRDQGVASGKGPSLAESIDPELLAQQLPNVLATDRPVCFLVHPKDMRPFRSAEISPRPSDGSLKPEAGATSPKDQARSQSSRQAPGPNFRVPVSRRPPSDPVEDSLRSEGQSLQPMPDDGPGATDHDELTRLEDGKQEAVGQSSRQPEDLRALLAGHLARALRLNVSDLDPDVPFQRLGLDSLTALDLVKTIEGDLGIELPTTLLFEANSLARLTEHIQGRMNDVPRKDDGQTTTEAPRRDEVDPFPLLGAQETFLASSEYYPHLPGVVFLRLDITGPIEESWLHGSLDLLVHRHPMLAARFFWQGDRPLQQPGGGLAPQLLVVRPKPGDNVDEFCSQVERQARNTSFQLDQGPVFRLTWCPLEQGRHSLMLALHHIAADAWSAGIVARELLAILAARASNQEPVLPPLPTDFERASRALARPRPNQGEVKAYWANHLAGAPTLIPLPFDGDPAAEPKGPFSIHQTMADQRLTTRLEDLAKRLDVSFFSLLLLSYELAIFRWSGSSEFVVRTANARRDLRIEGTDRIVGSFADSLPLRLHVDESENLLSAAQAVQHEVVASVRHADISSREIANLVGKRVSGGPRGVSPAGISFPDFDAPVQVGPLSLRGIRAGAGAGLTQLGLIAWRFAGRLVLSYSFLEDLFHPRTIEQMGRDHMAVIETLCEAAPRDPLSSILERAVRLSPPSGTHPNSQGRTDDSTEPVPSRIESPTPLFDTAILAKRLAESFDDHANATAMSEGDRDITYRSLGASARDLAGTLTELGARPGRLVGVLARPGSAALRAVLGIIWSGAAYVPLDPDHPWRRSEIIARDAEIDLLVTTADLLAHIPENIMERLDAVVLADRSQSTGEPIRQGAIRIVGFAESGKQTLASPRETDPVYVMYTSGTTGRPKGVVVDNRALAIFHDWVASAFDVRPEDRFVQTSSLAFGGSVRQMYSPLLAGASVQPVSSLTKKDPRSLVEFLETRRITIWNSVPSLFLRLAETVEDMAVEGRAPRLESLRWILLGGENLPASHVRIWRRLFGSRHRIANLYGSTETVVNATWFEVADPEPSWTSVPIGKARSGSLVTLRDEQNRPVEPGTVGEILVGGPSLAQGYLGAPDLTAKAFVTLAEKRFYRTGDLAKALPSGDLVYLGRRDNQVQIYGNRVELAEIEGLLTNQPSVRAAVVLAQRDERTWRLTAWVEPAAPDDPPDPVELRRKAASFLPAYMVPHRIVVRDHLPRNQAGKLDRLALAAQHRTSDERKAASGEFVDQVLNAFRRVLHRDDLQDDENFFDAGGDSILALELFRLLGQTLSDLPRPVVIYSHPTAKQLADAISRHRAKPRVSQAIPSHQDDATSWPVTPMQAGFLVMERVSGQTTSNWTATIPLLGPLTPQAFTSALEFVTKRHDVLRSRLEHTLEGWRQIVVEPISLPLEIEDISRQTHERQQQILDRSHQEFGGRTIDPNKAPAWRVRLWKLGPESWTIQFAFHHAFADGWSIALLGRELLETHDALVRGQTPDLAPRAPSYGTAAQWLAQFEPSQRDVSYWKERFGTSWTPPSDVSSQDRNLQEEHTESVSVLLDERRSLLLRQAAQRFGVSKSSLFVALFAKTLANWTGQGQQIIGMAHSGRDLPIEGTEEIFGCLAQAVPLRIDLGLETAKDDTHTRRTADLMGSIVQAANDALTGALQHAIPPDRLAAELGFGPNPPGSRFFLSIMDFSTLVRPGLLRPDWAKARFSFAAQATDTKILCSILTTDRTRITFHGTLSKARRSQLLDDFLDGIDALDDSGPSAGVANRSAKTGEQTSGPAQAALAAYLPGPQRLKQLLGDLLPSEWFRAANSPDELRRAARLLAQTASSAQPAELLQSKLGTSALYFVPLLADEMSDPGRLTDALVNLARRANQQRVGALSLAGMIPAFTDYGRLVEDAFDREGLLDQVHLTTGHAATAAAIAMNIESLLHRLATDISRIRLAVVGFGSVGRAATDLVLTEIGTPRQLVICDRAHRLEILDPDLAALEAFCGCPVRTVAGLDRRLPESILSADVIIGASSTADLIDPWEMEPGSVLLDDSFPPIADTKRAMDRMEAKRDILVAGAGRLQVEAISRTSPLVTMLTGGSKSPQDLARRLGPGMAGCRVESLLLSQNPDLPAVIGPVRAEQAKSYLKSARQLGIKPAVLHIGTVPLQEKLVEDFQESWYARIRHPK